MIHRHAVVTASSVAVVLLAGGTATALNLGVLEPTDGSSVGSASADAVVVADAEQPNGDRMLEAGTVRRFKVGSAGIMTARLSGGSIEVTELSPSPGWTARTDRLAVDSVVVTFVGSDSVVSAEMSVIAGRIVVESDELVAPLDASASPSAVDAALPVATSSTRPPDVATPTSPVTEDGHDDDGLDEIGGADADDGSGGDEVDDEVDDEGDGDARSSDDSDLPGDDAEHEGNDDDD